MIKMENAKTRSIQLAALECLHEVKRICEANDIPYFLSWGSALGAVRHKGFIPWDDDVDICMMYPDYLKFLEVCKTQLNTDKFFIQTPETDYNTLLPYAKLRMNNTTSMDKKYSHIKMHWGICIDIFPIRNAPDGEKARKKLVFLSMLYRLTLRRQVITGKNKLLVNTLCTLFGEKRFRKMLIDKIDAMCESGNNDDVFDMEGISVRKIFYPKKLVDSVANLTFEDSEFPCPKEIDGYLTYLYGDYMTPPPNADRTGHTGVIIDLEKNFTEYQNEK